MLTLLGAGHEVGRGIGAHRHEREDPREQRALIDEVVEVLFRGDGLRVLRGIAAGDAERQSVLLQQLHGMLDLGIRARATAAVGCLLEALGADGGNEVLHADHFLAERLVDQRAVGEGEEHAVGVHLAKLDEVLLADQRLAARVDVHVGAQLFALLDDGVDFLKAQVLPIAVLRRPAARAVQVAGARRVEQDGPRDVALVLFAVGFLLRPRHEVAIDDERFHQFVANSRIGVVHDVHDKAVPVALVVNGPAKRRALRGKQILWCHLIQQVHDFHDVVLWVGQEVVNGLFERRLLDVVGSFHCSPSKRFVPYVDFSTFVDYILARQRDSMPKGKRSVT